jgi:AbiV family abortive infection protein
MKLKGQHIVGKLSRDVVLEFTAYTIINFSDLSATAKNLIEKESRFGLGRSIAIVAIEELGKLGVALRYLTNQIKEEEFADRIWRHPPKQALGQLFLVISPLIERLGSAQTSDNKSTITLEQFTQGIENNIDLFDKEIHALTPHFQNLIEILESGKLEKQRQAGLYVSILAKGHRATVQHPRSIEEYEAREVLALLEVFNSFIDKSPFDINQLMDFSRFDELSSLDGEAMEELKSGIDRMCIQLGQHM